VITFIFSENRNGYALIVDEGAINDVFNYTSSYDFDENMPKAAKRTYSLTAVKEGTGLFKVAMAR